MKMYLRISLLLLSLLFLLTACGKSGADQDDGTDHKHSAKEWTVDLESHKMICQCGEEFSKGSHTLKNNICTICNADVYYSDDGTATVMLYDTYGYCVLSLYYEDGELLYREDTAYVFDENDMPTSQKSYTNSVLTYEATYGVNREGYPYINKGIFYWEDGSKSEYTYDEFWNETTYKSYDENGDLLADFSYEYTLTEDGLYTHRWVYESGVLTEETKFVIADDEWGPMPIPTETTFYNEDGTKTVETYDEDGDVTARTEYDENGNVIG